MNLRLIVEWLGVIAATLLFVYTIITTHPKIEARYLLLTEATRAGSAMFPAVPSKLVVVDLETGSVKVSLALGRVTLVRFVSVPGSTLIYALLKDHDLGDHPAIVEAGAMLGRRYVKHG